MTAEVGTIIIMVAAFLLLVGWDIYVAFFNKVPNAVDTESGIIRRASISFAGLPLSFGVLMGHWFGPSIDLRVSPLWLLAFAALTSALHYGFLKWLGKPPVWLGLVYCCAGMPLGAIFWSQ